MMGGTRESPLTVSTWSIVKVFLIALAFWVLYVVREVILIFFVALLFSSVLETPVYWLQRKKIPRALSMIFIYVVVISVLSFLTLSIIPPLADQIRQLSITFPSYLERFLNVFKTSPEAFDSFRRGLQGLASTLATGTTNNVLGSLFNFFGGFISSVVVLVVTFYLVVEEDAMKRMLRSAVPDHYHPYLTQLFGKMQTKLGAWLRGQLILSLIVGVLVYIGLSILGVPYALVLAPLSALLEFVPYVGPITAAVPAVVIALSLSPVKGLIVVAMYVLIQQLENHILVPKVMQKAVGINPVISIMAILTGLKIAGALGVLVAIPLVAALSVLVKDFYPEIKGR